MSQAKEGEDDMSDADLKVMFILMSFFFVTIHNFNIFHNFGDYITR